MNKNDTWLVLLAGIIGLAVLTWNLINAERQDKHHLSKELLDLPYIVNKVDELGNRHFQLNWQEVIAIIALETNKDMSNITEEDLQEVTSEFIDHNRVLPFESVLEKLELNDEERERAYENLNQLKNYSYIPSKTDPNSSEMQFINFIREGAIESYQLYGILPSVTIAQAILESDWGRSELTTEANNLFGIKKGVNWKGQVAEFETKEGFNEYITDTFRKYPSLKVSIMDHGLFLKQNYRYTYAGVFDAKTYIGQAKALEEAGYSTIEDEAGNKIYANLLEELIRQYNLQLIDHEVLYS